MSQARNRSRAIKKILGPVPSKAPAEMGVLLEGLVQLQEALPTLLRQAADVSSTQTTMEKVVEGYTHLQYLQRRSEAVLLRLLGSPDYLCYGDPLTARLTAKARYEHEYDALTALIYLVSL